METLDVALRDELVDTLSILIANTEEIYLALGKSYPALIEELEKSLAHTASVIARFEMSDGAVPGQRAYRGNGRYSEIRATAGMAELIADTRQVIDSGNKNLELTHQDDGKLFASLDQAIGRLSSLDQVIARIKEDSIEMELISLNAMTVALKAGSAGRAFSYITEELKRLSARTIALADRIAGRGEDLLDMFRGLRGSLEEVQTFQNRLFGEFSARLARSFDDFESGVTQSIRILSDIGRQSTLVRDPLMAIMEGIQLQDVVKQSIDHVIISLKELTEPQGLPNTEERLDELTFLQTLPDLCHALLDDVTVRLEQSASGFRNNLDNARSLIDDVESKRAEFVSSVVDSGLRGGKKGASEAASVTRVFEQSIEMLHSLLADLDRSVSLKANLVERSRALMNEVSDLEDDFRAFSVLINRFHSIDIASRIEVVKQAVLQKMSGTVEEMTALTGRIEKDVNESLDSTKSFIKSVSGTMTAFRKTFQDEESFAATFAHDLRRRYDELSIGKNELVETIAGFSLFTGTFLTLFGSTSKDLDRVGTVLNEITNIHRKLDEIKERAAKERAALLRAKNLDDWKLRSRRLQSIIRRFTIFTHKRAAGQLGGFEVETGVEAGTVTLF